jgi:GNAT superfamily N-acetyltransferase
VGLLAIGTLHASLHAPRLRRAASRSTGVVASNSASASSTGGRAASSRRNSESSNRIAVTLPSRAFAPSSRSRSFPVDGAARAASTTGANDACSVPSSRRPHRVALGVALRRRTLTVRTTLTATGEYPVPVSFGFYPYLRLAGVARGDWHVELPAMRYLQLDARSIPTGASRPVAAAAGLLGARTFDDGYVDVPDRAEFVVAGGGRRITVRLEQGYPAAQVFAPATDDVICFEPMTASRSPLSAADAPPRPRNADGGIGDNRPMAPSYGEVLPDLAGPFQRGAMSPPIPAIEWFEGSRDELADLFALADDSTAALSAYRDLGRVLVARDGPAVIGHLQLVAGDSAGAAEVKRIAVREDRQGTGVGRMLLERAMVACRDEGRSELVVATAAAATTAVREAGSGSRHGTPRPRAPPRPTPQ